MPYTAVGHYRTWFYFSVKGVQKDDTLTFAIKGMAAQGKLYKMGLRPVFRVSPNSMKWNCTIGSKATQSPGCRLTRYAAAHEGGEHHCCSETCSVDLQ